MRNIIIAILLFSVVTIASSSRVIDATKVRNGSGSVSIPAITNITATEMSYLSGASSNIQNQINALSGLPSPLEAITTFDTVGNASYGVATPFIGVDSDLSTSAGGIFYGSTDTASHTISTANVNMVTGSITDATSTANAGGISIISGNGTLGADGGIALTAGNGASLSLVGANAGANSNTIQAYGSIMAYSNLLMQSTQIKGMADPTLDQDGATKHYADTKTSYTANRYGVVLSGASNTMVVLAPDASTTKILTSGGASANPSWQDPAAGYTAPVTRYSRYQCSGVSSAVSSKIYYWANTEFAAGGSDISYTSDSVNGDFYTVNTTGTYTVEADTYIGAGADWGLSLNISGADFTTAYHSLAHGKMLTQPFAGTGNGTVATRTYYFTAGDKIYVHGSGTNCSNIVSEHFSIIRIN